MKMIATVFHDDEQVRAAYRRLQDAGIPGDDIGIVLKEPGEPRRQEGWVRDADEWAGGGLGAALGGTAGLVGGVVAAGAVVAIPIVGPVLAVGALAGILSATGGTLGWLAGALTARGLDEQEAKHYQAEVERGGTVVTVQTDDDDVERVRNVLRAAGGREYQES
jgi:hypothetical protein